jgi:hypothetical protein
MNLPNEKSCANSIDNNRELKNFQQSPTQNKVEFMSFPSSFEKVTFINPVLDDEGHHRERN